MLARADSIGVFQVESRAQMATLPRLRPRVFYDLVVEVALIRPGPIQGGSVHPYLRRRNGEEEVRYLHPLLEKALRKTLGVPLFQEQLMQIAIDVAGFSAVEADQLRQAMSAKRSAARMERLRGRLYAGMAERGIVGEVADTTTNSSPPSPTLASPSPTRSRSPTSSTPRRGSSTTTRRPSAALLNSQPMGFWSPESLVADGRHHGVSTLRPDVNRSGAEAALVDDPAHPGGTAVRLGLASVRGIGAELAGRIAAGAPYASIDDLARGSG